MTPKEAQLRSTVDQLIATADDFVRSHGKPTYKELEEQLSTMTAQHEAAKRRVVELEKELVEVKKRLESEEGSSEILGWVADRLTAHGCEHGNDHSGTPPMMYPEWINCVVHHACKKSESKLAEAVGLLRPFAKEWEYRKEVPIRTGYVVGDLFRVFNWLAAYDAAFVAENGGGRG